MSLNRLREAGPDRVSELYVASLPTGTLLKPLDQLPQGEREGALNAFLDAFETIISHQISEYSGELKRIPGGGMQRSMRVKRYLHDLYVQLGLDRRASSGDIRRAYSEWAQQMLAGQALGEEALKRKQDQFELMINPIFRAYYDALRARSDFDLEGEDEGKSFTADIEKREQTQLEEEGETRRRRGLRPRKQHKYMHSEMEPSPGERLTVETDFLDPELIPYSFAVDQSCRALLEHFPFLKTKEGEGASVEQLVDLYELLGVSRTATFAEIKRRKSEFVRRIYADVIRSNSSDQDVRDVDHTLVSYFAVLGDRVLRAYYDLHRVQFGLESRLQHRANLGIMAQREEREWLLNYDLVPRQRLEFQVRLGSVAPFVSPDDCEGPDQIREEQSRFVSTYGAALWDAAGGRVDLYDFFDISPDFTPEDMYDFRERYLSEFTSDSSHEAHMIRWRLDILCDPVLRAHYDLWWKSSPQEVESTSLQEPLRLAIPVAIIGDENPPLSASAPPSSSVIIIDDGSEVPRSQRSSSRTATIIVPEDGEGEGEGPLVSRPSSPPPSTSIIEEGDTPAPVPPPIVVDDDDEPSVPEPPSPVPPPIVVVKSDDKPRSEGAGGEEIILKPVVWKFPFPLIPFNSLTSGMAWSFFNPVQRSIAAISSSVYERRADDVAEFFAELGRRKKIYVGSFCVLFFLAASYKTWPWFDLTPSAPNDSSEKPPSPLTVEPPPFIDPSTFVKEEPSPPPPSKSPPKPPRPAPPAVENGKKEGDVLDEESDKEEVLEDDPVVEVVKDAKELPVVEEEPIVEVVKDPSPSPAKSDFETAGWEMINATVCDRNWRPRWGNQGARVAAVTVLCEGPRVKRFCPLSSDRILFPNPQLERISADLAEIHPGYDLVVQAPEQLCQSKPDSTWRLFISEK